MTFPSLVLLLALHPILVSTELENVNLLVLLLTLKTLLHQLAKFAQLGVTVVTILIVQVASRVTFTLKSMEVVLKNVILLHYTTYQISASIFV